MESDRNEIQSSGRSGGRLALPDMPPGDPPLQDTALRFRQDCEQLLAKHSLLGVARGEYPPRALAVEENFPLELLPPLDLAGHGFGHFALGRGRSRRCRKELCKKKQVKPKAAFANGACLEGGGMLFEVQPHLHMPPRHPR